VTRAPVPGVVSGVRPGSLAAEAGIEPGDAVVSVAGRVPRDVVDLQFYQAENEVVVHFRKADGLDEAILFEKEIDEDLGLEFDRATWDDVTLCNNNCFFCFLKGLPKGMRKTLYMKDDDYRLSFLHGNFVTLTNLTDDDWARLEEQRLSPLNVSIHATGLQLRRQMLGNNEAPDVIEQLRRLGTLGIRTHTQIVLCPGVNDGDNLDESVRSLGALYPTVQTISVVPVGASPTLEEWSLARDGIELVRPTPEYARQVVRQVGALQRELRAAHGHTIVQCSDEYYVTAGASVPPRANYDGFPQYENGIGMVRRMLDDWKRTKRRLAAAGSRPQLAERHVVIASGTLAAGILRPIAAELAALTGARIEVHAVTNTVFGERVNVTGLLCGKDYIRELAAYRPDCFILPRPSLDYFGQKFLDSMTVDEVELALGAPLTFASQWSEVLRILERGPRRPVRNDAPNGAFWSEERARLPKGAAWVR
jgi:putative radical SAM enzyme (TIGR03279 family)